MLEPKTLVGLRVPDPGRVPTKTMKRILVLVKERVADPSKLDVEKHVDRLVADLYGLTPAERDEIGVE